jgi:hypothetical protein
VPSIRVDLDEETFIALEYEAKRRGKALIRLIAEILRDYVEEEIEAGVKP